MAKGLLFAGLIVLAALMALLAGANDHDRVLSAQFDRWEYRVVRSSNVVDPGEAQPAAFRAGAAPGLSGEAALNQLGAEGWELVSVGSDELVFKRLVKAHY
ncbi:MAG: hypothetical protein ACREJC_22050 [Tepidisphaeraceae bacterium]